MTDPSRGWADRPAELDPALAMLRRARWAAHALAGYSASALAAACDAASAAAADAAEQLALDVAAATGAGSVPDLTLIHLACAAGPEQLDVVRPLRDGAQLISRPLGVVLLTTGGDHPVAGVYLAVIGALASRNAVLLLVPPGPAERAAELLSAAADAAGAPGGCVQWLVGASPAVAAALAADPDVDLCLDLPAAPPAAVPVLIDASADVATAASSIIASVAFDHGLLPDAEDVLLVDSAVADALLDALRAEGVQVLDAEQAARLRALIGASDHAGGRLPRGDSVGLAAAARIEVPEGTRALLLKLDHVLPEEPLLQPLPLPVLRWFPVNGARQSLQAAQAVLAAGAGGSAAWAATAGGRRRCPGRGRTAAVHAADRATVLRLAQGLD
ncbi:MAG TPA: aldehyde dehydrogenase family protein, partial [Kineosporiaceae bacterium]|nr:aldehyde dehydrogenase family protein [Kineosporiaceae bacterium]